jgi:hypothetical protein
MLLAYLLERAGRMILVSNRKTEAAAPENHVGCLYPTEMVYAEVQRR